MTIGQVLHVSQKKLQSYRAKTLFLIVPITVLLIAGIILNSQVANIESATEKSVFSTIEEQGKLIQIEKASSSTGSARFQRNFTQQQDLFQASDVQKVEGIAGVATADLLNTVPLGKATTTTLVDGHTVTIPAFTGLDSDLAAQYTDQDFSYTANSTIPIIISTGMLTEQYEDWAGQTSMTLDFTRRSAGASPPSNPGSIGPVKTRTLTATKADLLGKTFTVTIGGFDAIQDYTTTPGESGITFTQRTADELAAAEQARNDAISPYWDYSALSKGQARTFKVVGVIDDSTSQSVYIPQTAASELVSNLIAAQVSARTATDIPTDSLNSTFTGITYDGLTLSSPITFGGRSFRVGGGGGGKRGGSVSIVGGAATATATTSYAIPGLIIKTDRTTSDTTNPFDSGTVSGVDTDTKVYDTATRSSATMLVKINNVSDRDTVIAALNSAGYTYRDSQKLGVLTNLKTRLQLFTKLFTLAFIGLVALILALALSRFISESKREIAIFRVIGATKAQIQQLVLGQAFIAAAVSGVIGIGVGLLGTIALAGPIHTWFSNLVISNLSATYPKIIVADTSVFRSIGWSGIALYAGLLLLLTLVVGILMSISAARVRPAEGVRER